MKVLDFGVAKLAPAANAAEATTGFADTQFGAVIGTTRYMSPEQARGVDVDGRSDIFSLGIVLYELLTGRAPFDGVTATDTLIAIMQHDPTPVTQLRPDTSSSLARVVAMCLEKDPTHRYASAGALAADLEALTRPPSPTAPGPSIAVLPFVNLSPDPQNEVLRGWRHRRDHHRPQPGDGAPRRRAQLVICVQGCGLRPCRGRCPIERRHSAHRQRARRRRPAPHRGAAG